MQDFKNLYKNNDKFNNSSKNSSRIFTGRYSRDQNMNGSRSIPKD